MTIATQAPSSFLVSAPGKVIIFGEHSAVYHRPAIAAAVSLRTYCLVKKDQTHPSNVTLKFPDINFAHSWDISEFPFDKISNEIRLSPELVPELVDLLNTTVLKDFDSHSVHHSAALAFVYLFTCLLNPTHGEGLCFIVRSSVPLGAGLGSSAALGVCLSSCMATLGHYITTPTQSGHIRADDSTPAVIDVEAAENGNNNVLGTVSMNSSTNGAAEIPKYKDIDFIDKWAFMAEKCMTGNPSGIDNAVSCYGGAVLFQRIKDGDTPHVRTQLKSFLPLKLLLTNTKQPKRTSTLVANVATLLQNFPLVCNPVLDSMENIAREGYDVFVKASKQGAITDEMHKKLSQLFRMNQALLSCIGVSHPKLDKIKMHCDDLNIGETKLTGAGGGGCAITLLNENSNDITKMQKLEQKLHNEGFDTFETDLGGKGVAMMCKVSNDIIQKYSVDEIIPDELLEPMVGVSHNPQLWQFW